MDFTDENTGCVYMYERLKAKYHFAISFIEYHSLINAIPVGWKKN